MNHSNEDDSLSTYIADCQSMSERTRAILSTANACWDTDSNDSYTDSDGSEFSEGEAVLGGSTPVTPVTPFGIDVNGIEPIPSTSDSITHTNVQYGGGAADPQTPNTQTRASVIEKDVPKFNGKTYTSPVTFVGIPTDNLSQLTGMIKERISPPIDAAMRDASSDSMLNITLSGSCLSENIHAVMPSDEVDISGRFLDEIVSVIQSNDTIMAETDLSMTVELARGSSGGGRRALTGVGYSHIRPLGVKNKTLYSPDNDDSICFSLCIAKHKYPKVSDKSLRRRATEIHQCTGKEISHRVALSDISDYEDRMRLKIVVFHHNNDSKALVLFQTPGHNIDGLPVVRLYLQDDHYSLILNMKKFHGRSYVCQFCHSGFNDKELHSCDAVCNICYTDCTAHNDDTAVAQTSRNYCGDCNQTCKSRRCYTEHKKYVHSVGIIPCDTRKKCTDCGMIGLKNGVKRKRGEGFRAPHICVPKKCRHCHSPLYDGVEHTCFIEKKKPKKRKDKENKYIIYDFETQVIDGIHCPNYVYAHDLDEKPEDRVIFEAYGLDCVDKFLFEFRKPKYRKKYRYAFLAHNAGGFDNHIVLKQLIKDGIEVDTIMRGGKIISIEEKITKIRWIDSLSFLPMRLADTPAAMGFTDQCKGFFPHIFNTAENQSYVGPYPAPMYYGYDQMKTGDQLKFKAWYDTVTGKTFDFRKELALYCRSDVMVLRAAVNRYRNAFISETKIDPFGKTTLAGACMEVFKSNFLPNKTIALTYEGAYHDQDKTYSTVSIEWLEYLNYTEKSNIVHALNGGERKIGPYYADGYIAEKKQILSFAGCFWHGCKRCHRPCDFNPVTQCTYGSLHQRFINRQKFLEEKEKMQVITMWECEWSRMKRTDPSVQAFLKNYKHPKRLDPREAVFGGRTTAIKLYHEIKTDDGKILYVDFTSLYPYVQSCKPYPVGHPKIILKGFDNIKTYFGLAK